MLVIDPDECIDCTLCVAECPVEAIFAEDEVPSDQRHFIRLNAELAKSWKPISEKKTPPREANEWAKVKKKEHLLQMRPRDADAALEPDSGVAFSRGEGEPSIPPSAYGFGERIKK